MEKRALHFIIITILFLIAYTYLISKFYPQRPPSSPPLPQQPYEYEEVKEFLSERPHQGELQDVEVGDFVVSISLLGGYINNIRIKSYGEELNFRNIGFLPDFKDVQFSLSIPKKNWIVLENEELGVKKIWEFTGYAVRFKLVLPQGKMEMNLFSNYLSPNGLDQRYQEIFFKEDLSGIITRLPFRKIKDLRRDLVQIAGARDRYFCLAFFQGKFSVGFKRKDKTVTVSTTIDKKESLWNFYLGPQLAKELAKHNLEGIIYYGFFHGIGAVILKVLYIFNSLTHSWGFSIILLSIIIYLLLFPFTAKSTKAMQRMQELQPAIESLRSKYKDNPQKLNKEMLELYKKHKINPLGGCFPLLFQFPVFIALYQVLLRFVELKGAQFLWIKDLSLPDHSLKLPFSLPYFGQFINILPLLIVIISYFQQKITTSKVSSQQQSMGLFFIFFIGIIFYHFPSCLVLYWFIQNILTFFYQYRASKLTLLRE